MVSKISPMSNFLQQSCVDIVHMHLETCTKCFLLLLFCIVFNFLTWRLKLRCITAVLLRSLHFLKFLPDLFHFKLGCVVLTSLQYTNLTNRGNPCCYTIMIVHDDLVFLTLSFKCMKCRWYQNQSHKRKYSNDNCNYRQYLVRSSLWTSCTSVLKMGYKT